MEVSSMNRSEKKSVFHQNRSNLFQGHDCMISVLTNRSSQRGLAIVLTLFIIMMLALFGVIYYKSSTDAMNEAYIESERIRARALARAGMEKAMVIIRDRYKKAHYEWKYPEQGSDPIGESEFSGQLEGGQWTIDSVEPYVYGNGLVTVGPYRRIPYSIYGTRRGVYDILEIKSQGRMLKSGIRVSLSGLIKIIREDVDY